MQLDQPQFGMPSRDYFLKSRDDRALMAYESYATAVATSLGANPVTALRDMHDMVDFEILLANVWIINYPEYELLISSCMFINIYAVNQSKVSVLPEIFFQLT